VTADRCTVDDLAAALSAAERDGTSTPLASHRFVELDWADARRVALARDALRIDDGDELVGYKLGWTSAAMREALGIDRPNWGTLWRSQQLDGLLDPRPLRHAKVEPEIVYVAGRDLVGDTVTADDVIEGALGWAVGIEVVHPRWPSFDFTWLDNTADNSSAHAVAMSEPVAFEGDPAGVAVYFSDGDEERPGRGDQAMGSPADAVAWLVRALGAEGRSVEAGQIVFTGGITAPFDVISGERYTARSPQLGLVTIDVETPPPASP